MGSYLFLGSISKNELNEKLNHSYRTVLRIQQDILPLLCQLPRYQYASTPMDQNLYYLILVHVQQMNSMANERSPTYCSQLQTCSYRKKTDERKLDFSGGR
mmetsp:Transcript_35996/g.42988  ORF Transcript_35996/g.42988 Transcript_35996/m.42988 type:complete len:101 (+) Transcript_35996:2068-2370(+)